MYETIKATLVLFSRKKTATQPWAAIMVHYFFIATEKGTTGTGSYEISFLAPTSFKGGRLHGILLA
jgi:hypothetical protein